MPKVKKKQGGAVKLSDNEMKDAKKRFLIAFKRSGNWSYACERAAVKPSTIRSWLEKDEKFAKRFDDAQEQFVDSLEMVAVQRAVEKSDTLLLALLKANRPAKFRENVKVDADVKQDKTVRLVFSADEIGDAMPNFATGVNVPDDTPVESGDDDE